jgi:toxin ParE1/3/4
MGAYELSAAADADLETIAEYIIRAWGIEQARRYEALLQQHFQEIGGRKIRARVFLKHRPELLVSRCQHHYVFQLVRKKKCPLILAVLQENMDLIGRIHERLEWS